MIDGHVVILPRLQRRHDENPDDKTLEDYLVVHHLPIPNLWQILAMRKAQLHQTPLCGRRSLRYSQRHQTKAPCQHETRM
jgi:hypothetical protein